MRWLLGYLLVIALVSWPISFVRAAEPKKEGAPAATAAPPESPSIPSPKKGPDGMPQAGFIKAHESFLARAKQGNVDVLFLGDSITAGWATRGKAVWTERYEKMNAANFGIGGDRTQHVLWRITNGELEGISPKVVVLMIGTNNTGANDVPSIAEGVSVIVKTIRQKLPNTKVMLLAIFPRGEKPENPARAKITQINEIISKLDDGKMVRYLDIGPKFLQPDGTLPKDIMPDSLHPNEAGYKIWADAIAPLLAEMMK